VASSSRFHAGLSSVKREKRTPSPSIALESTRKNPGQEKAVEDMPDRVEGEEYELDSETERDFDCVGRVLKMLSTSGTDDKCIYSMQRDCMT